jgi:hypothetical protein
MATICEDWTIGAMQRVHEKKLPDPLPQVSLIDGEAPEKCGRRQPIRNSAGDRRGQAAGIHAERRDRVAEDRRGGFAATATQRAPRKPKNPGDTANGMPVFRQAFYLSLHTNAGLS